MIDLLTNIPQKASFQADHSQLLISYDTLGASRSYDFENVVFAHMKRGVKNVTFESGEEVAFMPNTVIMGTDPLHVDVNIPDAAANDPAYCFTLEIDKHKIRKTMDRFYEEEATSHLVYEEKEVSPIEVYTGIGASTVIKVLEQLEELIMSEVRFKDRWVDLKLEELILCCLQTNLFQTIINFYQEDKLLHSPIGAVVKYLKEHSHQKITIEQLTQEACMSQATLFRNFKKKLGVTPLEFINLERIKKAEKALSSSEIPISEIGYMVGYNSPSYFLTQFKKVNACSPSEFRKNLLQSRDIN